MYEIIIKGPVGKVEGTTDLAQLDGVDCQENFADYFDDDMESIIDKEVRSGYMSFKYQNGQLKVIVRYLADEMLTDAEAAELVDYTQGQLSDGIGEGFEQEPCREIDGKEIFISPWFSGQQLEFHQMKL